jgi:hypothetical protein
MDGVITFQEAKKAQRKVGDLEKLHTNYKSDTVGAINELEYSLSLLLPSPPPNLSSKSLTMNGTVCLLAQNVPNHSPSNIQSGSSVRGTRTLRPESATVSTFGAGDNGILSILVNGVIKGSKELTKANDTGTFGDLVISKDQDFPIETPGFWQALDARFKPSDDLSLGYHEVQMKHSISGDTNKAAVVIDLNVSPIVSELKIEQDFLSPSYSSGIPHYGSGSKLKVSGKVRNTITYVYENTLADVSGDGLFTKGYNLNDLGILAITGQEISFSDVLTLNRNFVGFGKYTLTGRHPLTTNNSQTSNENILVKIGSGGVNEGLRVSTNQEDFPSQNDITPNFNSSQLIAPHEAKIVGGVLKHDLTNYAFHLPIGPDYSNHNTNQFACFVFYLNASTNANIILTGTGLYEKCWVKLPNVTGWLDTDLLYDGASTDFSDGRPCKVSGTKSNFVVTFGTNSSALSNNKILVRFRMLAGQTITSITVNRG